METQLRESFFGSTKAKYLFFNGGYSDEKGRRFYFALKNTVI